MKGLYNTRDSTNQAAPEPIFLGQQFCMAIDLCYRVGVDATNPYNPFGFTLDGNSPDFGLGRRPIEGGPRIFKQTVDTKYYATGINGDFNFGDHQWFWDVNYVNSSNKASQTVTGTYNIRHIMNALGPVDECVAPCVPLNLFGGPGTITPDMLNYILFTENDRSKQSLSVWTANISGNLFQLPAGALDAAAGFEHRNLSGFYTPDSVVTAGDSNGVPSGPTSGSYDVDEFYVELNAPLLADMPLAKHLDLSVASRYSDYSNFGSTTNNKIGFRWQMVEDFTFRGTWAEGFRAPSIGELFSTFSRFDASLVDPCGGNVTANCATLGVPPGFTQNNPQISIITGGNQNLQPETSKSLTLGAIYSPSWAENTELVAEDGFRADLLPPQDQAMRSRRRTRRRSSIVASRRSIRCSATASRARATARSTASTTRCATSARSTPRAMTSASTGSAPKPAGAHSARACRRPTRKALRPSPTTPARSSRARSASKSRTARFHAGAPR